MMVGTAIYKFKTEIRKKLKEDKITITDLANRIGINRSYASQIVNGRKTTKVVAYCITKAISPMYEIADVFDIE